MSRKTRLAAILAAMVGFAIAAFTVDVHGGETHTTAAGTVEYIILVGVTP
jgi:hypothetical protein